MLTTTIRDQFTRARNYAVIDRFNPGGLMADPVPCDCAVLEDGDLDPEAAPACDDLRPTSRIAADVDDRRLIFTLCPACERLALDVISRSQGPLPPAPAAAPAWVRPRDQEMSLRVAAMQMQQAKASTTGQDVPPPIPRPPRPVYVVTKAEADAE